MKRRRRRRSKVPKILLLLLCILLGTVATIACKADLRQTVQAETIPFQENKISEEALTDKYYYQQLTEEEQIVYKEISQGLENVEEEIYVHSSDGKLVNRIFTDVMNDSPELFWCDGSAQTSSYEQQLNTGAYSIVKPNYTYTGEERENRQNQIDAAVEEIMGQISMDSQEYDKIKFVFDTLVNQTDYNLDAPDNQNIYSVFVNKVSVCAGYSKATQYLLEKMGVFCTYVTGRIPEQGAHAWNLVRCDGTYYYVDTTWGDPVFQQEENEPVVDMSNINYDYLCCDDTELFKTHTLDEDMVMPACTSMDRNYYVMNGLYYESYDSQQILKAMNDTIYSGGEQTVFKFASDEVYNEAHDPIISELIPTALDNLALAYDLSQVQYSYVEDSDSDKFVIVWSYE
ncbi:MAG: transglutaminase domain-containing protein [Hespellia sp.]|nr:transglutaminase domain-containing protein [Hespellia sp.]